MSHQRHVVSRSGWVVLLGAGLCLFVPWSPVFFTDYYEYAMHLAAVHGWQFGTEVLATYGPLGFIGLPFFEQATYPILIVANVLLYALSVLFLCGFWRSVISSTGPPALWIVAILLLPAFGPSRYWAGLIVPSVRSRERARAAAGVLGAASAAHSERAH